MISNCDRHGFGCGFVIGMGVGLWVVGLWFQIVIGMGVGLWVVGLWLRIVIDVGLWVVGLGPNGSWCNGRHDGFAFVEVCCGGFVCVFCSLAWWVFLSVFFFLSSHWFGFCDCDGGWFVIWKRKGVAGPFFFFFFVAKMDMGLLGWDGSVWVCWIDRWVWVVGFFFQWWWMGWVWVCYSEIVKFAGLRVTKRKREKEI